VIPNGVVSLEGSQASIRSASRVDFWGSALKRARCLAESRRQRRIFAVTSVDPTAPAQNRNAGAAASVSVKTRAARFRPARHARPSLLLGRFDPDRRRATVYF